MNAGFDMEGMFYMCLNKNWGWSSCWGRCAPEAYFLNEAVCVVTGKNRGRDVPVALYLTADKGQHQNPRELHLLRLCDVPENIMEVAVSGRRQLTEEYLPWAAHPPWDAYSSKRAASEPSAGQYGPWAAYPPWGA